MREDEGLGAAGSPLQEHEADVKDVEIRSRGSEEDEIAIAQAPAPLRELRLRQASEAERSWGDAGDDVHPTREEARLGAAREIGEQALANIGANPFDHVVMSRVPSDSPIVVTNAPQPSPDVARRARQGEREHRFHIGDAVETGQGQSENFALRRATAKRILDVGTTAQEASRVPQALAKRRVATQLAKQRGDLLWSGCARSHRLRHPWRLYGIGRRAGQSAEKHGNIP